jgi:hypothetical protein
VAVFVSQEVNYNVQEVDRLGKGTCGASSFYPFSVRYNPAIYKKKLFLQHGRNAQQIVFMSGCKGIESRHLHICFLVSIDISEVPTPYGAVRLLLKCHFFRVEFFDFRVSA